MSKEKQNNRRAFLDGALYVDAHIKNDWQNPKDNKPLEHKPILIKLFGDSNNVDCFKVAQFYEANSGFELEDGFMCEDGGFRGLF